MYNILNNWIFLSILALLTSSIGCIAIKYIDTYNYDQYILFSITFIIMGIIGLIYIINNTKSTKIFYNKCSLYLILFIIFFATVLIFNNIVIYHAFKKSPNIAYSHIIINFNVIISILAAYILFKQNISLKSFIGIIIAIIGISITVLN